MAEAVWRSVLFRLVAALLMLAPAPLSAAEEEQSVNPGANDGFFDPAIGVEHWRTLFEGPRREVYQAQEAITAALGLRRGQIVADIGSGTGYYSLIFGEKVGPDGHVYAVDIAPKFLMLLNQRVEAEGRRNITAVLGRPRSAALPAGVLDRAFICDAYHRFEYPRSMLASIFNAMKPGGEVVLVEFDLLPNVSRPWIANNIRGGKSVFQREFEQAGFAFVEEVAIPGLRENYFLRFKKPGGKAGDAKGR